MKISRVWAMPNKWTFKIKPIRELLERYEVGKSWVDPFAGQHSPAEITNDHRPEANSKYHMDAVEFADAIDYGYLGCLFDPPYSIHEVKRHYDSLNRKYDFASDPTCSFKKVRDLIAPKVERVIYFGWNTNAFGKKRGFEIEEVLIVAHGGNRNDTLVTVEKFSADFRAVNENMEKGAGND